MTRHLIIPLLLVSATAQAGVFYHDPMEHGTDSVILQCVPLPAIDVDPAGSASKAGITSATAGLEIDVRADNSNGWAFQYSQAAATIDALSGNPGTFSTPPALNMLFGEIAASSGCYQLVFDNAIFDIVSAKTLMVRIRDSSSPTFSETWMHINLNAAGETDVRAWIQAEIEEYDGPTKIEMDDQFTGVDETLALGVDIGSVNGITVDGSGTSADPWGPVE